jgi:hypothetical protein
MALRQMDITVKLALLLAVIASAAGGASAQVTATPSSITFGSVAVNIAAYSPSVTLTNNNKNSVTLSSITFGIPQYGLSFGLPTQTLAAHSSVAFTFIFQASKAGTYNSTITFNIKNQASVVVQGSANAFVSNAITTLSSTSLNFGTVDFGSTSTQSVTVTNTGGPNSINIAAVYDYYEPFGISGPATPVTLGPGQSATYEVTFSPLVTGLTDGILTFCYNNLPCDAVDLTGTGAAPTQFALTNYPALPYGTQGFVYQANVAATGGTPPYQYRVLSGNMPTGLTMAKTGAITGTISSTAATGTYSFTVQAQDSSQPKRLSATEAITLTLEAPTGANCAITSVNVPNTSTPIVDLMDLGTGTYQGYEGGLYPNGLNTDPDPHDSDGVAIAQSIEPLNSSGQQVPGGTCSGADPACEILISIGESASQQPFLQFITEANADREKNPNLVIVDGAEGGATASYWALPGSDFWTQLISYSIPYTGFQQGIMNPYLNSKQVVAAWVSDVNSLTGQGATFPTDAETLQGNYENIANLLLTKFPNIKLMLFSSINYTGYSQGITSTLPEPQGYESAFGAKWAIQDQINGDPNLNYNSANGPVEAPWMGWSFYYWANGLIPRSDGITWSCQDLKSDGLHPAGPWGHEKIAQYLLNWFKTGDVAAPWFLAPPQ